LPLTLLLDRKRGFRGKKGGGGVREAKQELRRQERTFPQVSLGQGCWMERAGENMERGVGLHSRARAEGARDESYLLMIGSLC